MKKKIKIKIRKRWSINPVTRVEDSSRAYNRRREKTIKKEYINGEGSAK